MEKPILPEFSPHPNHNPHLDQKQPNHTETEYPRLPPRKPDFPFICIDFCDYVVYTHAIIFTIDNIKLFKRNYKETIKKI